MATIISLIKAILLKPVTDVCKLISKIINACGLKSRIIDFCVLESKITIDPYELKSKII